MLPRIAADVTWLQGRLNQFPTRALVSLVNASDQRGALAIQGPKVAQFIDGCFSKAAMAGTPVERPTALKKNDVAAFPFGDGSVWVARTGYTGEDGFEIVAPAESIEALWNLLLDRGQADGLKPCGLAVTRCAPRCATPFTGTNWMMPPRPSKRG